MLDSNYTYVESVYSQRRKHKKILQRQNKRILKRETRTPEKYDFVERKSPKMKENKKLSLKKTERMVGNSSNPNSRPICL